MNCPHCQGYGFTETKVCEYCRGTGEADPPPEKTRSQKMLEAGFTRRPTWKSLPKDGDDDPAPPPAPRMIIVDEITETLPADVWNDARD